MQSDFLMENWSLSKEIRNHSYKQIINDQNTDIQRNKIYNLLLEHPEGVTDLEICLLTGFSRTSVTARRNEIPDVIMVGIAKLEGGRVNTLWGIDPNPLAVSGTLKR